MPIQFIVFILGLLFFTCAQKKENPVQSNAVTEFSEIYSPLTTEKVYSKNVSDTFKIFKATPEGYGKNPLEKYPLIIVLDANAFIESTISELKFNTFIGLIPKSIVVGVGYKDFATMDSLRSRDYTYPLAIPEYEMSLSGGANKFKQFLDAELVPLLTRQYNIDMNKSVICGHSLGGYLTLYYGLKSIEEQTFVIKNIVSASPSLHYNKRYLFQMEAELKKPTTNLPLKVYISMGSEEMADEESKGILDSFEKQIRSRNYGIELKTAEYTNFGHIDAAIPGFMKGLTYIFTEE